MRLGAVACLAAALAVAEGRRQRGGEDTCAHSAPACRCLHKASLPGAPYLTQRLTPEAAVQLCDKTCECAGFDYDVRSDRGGDPGVFEVNFKNYSAASAPDYHNHLLAYTACDVDRCKTWGPGDEEDASVEEKGHSPPSPNTPAADLDCAMFGRDPQFPDRVSYLLAELVLAGGGDPEGRGARSAVCAKRNAADVAETVQCIGREAIDAQQAVCEGHDACTQQVHVVAAREVDICRRLRLAKCSVPQCAVTDALQAAIGANGAYAVPASTSGSSRGSGKDTSGDGGSSDDDENSKDASRSDRRSARRDADHGGNDAPASSPTAVSAGAPGGGTAEPEMSRSERRHAKHADKAAAKETAKSSKSSSSADATVSPVVPDGPPPAVDFIGCFELKESGRDANSDKLRLIFPGEGTPDGSLATCGARCGRSHSFLLEEGVCRCSSSVHETIELSVLKALEAPTRKCACDSHTSEPLVCGGGDSYGALYRPALRVHGLRTDTASLLADVNELRGRPLGILEACAMTLGVLIAAGAAWGHYRVTRCSQAEAHMLI